MLSTKIQQLLSKYISEDDDVTYFGPLVSTWGHRGAFYIKFSYKVINEKEHTSCIAFTCERGAYVLCGVITKLENIEKMLESTFELKLNKCEDPQPYPTSINRKRKSIGPTLTTFPVEFIAESYVTTVSAALKSSGPAEDPDSKVAITAKLTFIHNKRPTTVSCEIDFGKNKIYLEGTDQEYFFKNSAHVLEVIREQFDKYIANKLPGANDVNI